MPMPRAAGGAKAPATGSKVEISVSGAEGIGEEAARLSVKLKLSRRCSTSIRAARSPATLPSRRCFRKVRPKSRSRPTFCHRAVALQFSWRRRPAPKTEDGRGGADLSLSRLISEARTRHRRIRPNRPWSSWRESPAIMIPRRTGSVPTSSASAPAPASCSAPRRSRIRRGKVARHLPRDDRSRHAGRPCQAAVALVRGERRPQLGAQQSLRRAGSGQQFPVPRRGRPHRQRRAAQPRRGVRQIQCRRHEFDVTGRIPPMRDANGTIDFRGNDLDIALRRAASSWPAAGRSRPATASC